MADCPTCDGTGVCPVCKGDGYIDNMRKPLSRGMMLQVLDFIPGPAAVSSRFACNRCSLVVARLAS